MTIAKRFTALIRAIGYMSLRLFLFFNQRVEVATDIPDSDIAKMKANFAYFLGNPEPLGKLRNQEDND